MIQIVTGKLGAGKTLYTVMMLTDSLCRGATVCTNIAVDWPALCRHAALTRRVILDPAQLVKVDPSDKAWHEKIPFGKPGDFVEVYLDEIHLFFNARDWATTSKESRGLLSFLTQSRKAGVNVTFIAQEITTVEKQFRCLAEWELYVFNSDHIPLSFLGKFPIKFFVVSQRDAQNGNLLKKHFRSYDKRFFKLYGSFTFLDVGMQALASKASFAPSLKLSRVPVFRWLLSHLRALIPQTLLKS